MPAYLKILDGVRVPSVVIIAAAAINAKTMLMLQTNVTITSGNDSKHKEGSLHYQDRALDFRTHDMPPYHVRLWADEIRNRLGPKYDVIVEDDHIHVEHNL